MAIAHDSEILGAASTAAGNYDTAITPAATPSGVCVVIVQGGAATDFVTSVTYGTGAGAVALIRRRFATEGTEPGGVYIYWGAGTFPAGAQTVRVVRTGTSNMRAAVSTMTVAAGQTVAVDSDATGQATTSPVANPSWTHTTLTDNVVAYEGIHSGLQAMVNTPRTSPVVWTLAPTPGFDDIGNTGRGWARATLGTAGALSPGWTAATAEDFVGASIAFKEAPPLTAAAGGRLVQNRRAVTRASNW